MAYISQETKKRLAADIKKVIPKDWKVTFGVRHNSTFVITIQECPAKVFEDYIGSSPNRLHDINLYHLNHFFKGDTLAILEKIKAAANSENHDESRPEIDYFDVGYYVDIGFGKWDKPVRMTQTDAENDKLAKDRMLTIIREEFGSLESIDPESPKYFALRSFFGTIGKNNLQILADANIPTISELARESL